MVLNLRYTHRVRPQVQTAVLCVFAAVMTGGSIAAGFHEAPTSFQMITGMVAVVVALASVLAAAALKKILRFTHSGCFTP